jgi:hypothetical protein
MSFPSVPTSFSPSPLHSSAVFPVPTLAGEASASDGLLEQELSAMSAQLARTFEELSLIHDLSCNLGVASNRVSHCQEALSKIVGCVPAETISIVLTNHVQAQLNNDAFNGSLDTEQLTSNVSVRPPQVEVVQVGKKLDDELLIKIHEELGPGSIKVANHPLRCAPHVPQSASVPMQIGPQSSSCLLAIRKNDGEEFGTIELQLMESVAMILKGQLEVYRQLAEMRQMFEGTVRALVSAIDAKDPYTCGHSSRVAEMGECLAIDYGMTASEAETVKMSGLLHDIGKIGVSDAVLRKPGRLNDAEFAEIKKHPELGYRILCGVRQFSDILPGVRYHHEAWDGQGYPQGLAGESIPLIARILAVADSFDAMTSTRPYRSGMPIEQVESIFRDGRGKQWDAKIVDLLLADRPRMVRMMHHSHF